MENKKQTAVEWLKNQALEGSIDKLENVMYLKLPLDIFIKAKLMEKEQIIEAYYKGVRHEWEGAGKDFEDFYNETYGTPR